MSEDLGTVLDAPEVTNADEVVEQPNEVQPEEGSEEVVQQEAQPEPKGDERVLPQWIRNLKTVDPQAFKDAKATFFSKRTLDEKLKDFDLDGTKSFLEQYGGREGLSATLNELQGKAESLDGIITKLESADPSLVADLVQTSPEGFVQLAPVIDQQWQQADPEGWAAHVSGIFAATIQQNGIPSFLDRLDMMLEFGKADDARAMIQKLKDWAGGFAERAQAPRQAPQSKGVDKLAEREQAIAQREAQVFTEDVKRDVTSFRDPLITKELETYFSRRPKDNDARELAISTVRSQVVERMRGDKDFQNALNAFTARRDKEGALRLIKSRETAAIQEIAPKVGRMIFGNPATAKAEEKKTDPGQQKVNPDAGFTLVEKAPDPKLIDRFRTTDAMIMRGKFILKDGRKLELAG